MQNMDSQVNHETPWKLKAYYTGTMWVKYKNVSYICIITQVMCDISFALLPLLDCVHLKASELCLIRNEYFPGF